MSLAPCSCCLSRWLTCRRSATDWQTLPPNVTADQSLQSQISLGPGTQHVSTCFHLILAARLPLLGDSNSFPLPFSSGCRQLLAPNLIQKHFLPGGVEQFSKQVIGQRGSAGVLGQPSCTYLDEQLNEKRAHLQQTAHLATAGC